MIPQKTAQRYQSQITANRHAALALDEFWPLYLNLPTDNKSFHHVDGEYTLTVEGQQVVGLVDVYKYLMRATEQRGFDNLMEKVA
ncbi:hypothetical protein [uncultured Paraglaciecola sp.]|uniref:hypothetical protein n=1 Tax=uncultured Paraglaciecola sp. TaxID=1765024 RepID=UPI002607EBC4|nr:hypothetical protein [uncultured Paraglaciecola sp.]